MLIYIVYKKSHEINNNNKLILILHKKIAYAKMLMIYSKQKKNKRNLDQFGFFRSII